MNRNPNREIVNNSPCQPERMREALIAIGPYAQHAPICRVNESRPRKNILCDCGLIEAIQNVEDALAPSVSGQGGPKPEVGGEWTAVWGPHSFVHLLDGTGKLLSDGFHDMESAEKVRDAHNQSLAIVTAQIKDWIEDCEHYFELCNIKDEKITALRSENQKLREALERIATIGVHPYFVDAEQMQRIASAALPKELSRAVPEPGDVLP